MTDKFSKILMILLIVFILLNMFSKSIYAVVKIDMNRALIKTYGYTENHLKYYRENSGEYTYHRTILAGYEGEDGTVYPVYCMNIKLPGADKEPYYVTTNKILENDKVWRIIKNGYPFKTAKEWGLNDEKDVYAITRFAIYCVLGEEKLSYFKAEEDDKEAVAMHKALKQLVDIGENGTEKQNDEPLSTEKVSELKEYGDYYRQEYKVKSTSEFNKYTIKNTIGLPEGGFIANSNGERKNTFLKDENFYIMIPKKELSKNIDVQVTINAECRAYIVLDGQTTVPGTQNYAVTMGEYATIETTASLKQNVDTCKIVISKYDSETKHKIEGVEFQLQDEKGNNIDTKVTNEEGILEFENLVQGEYRIVETKARDQYILPEEERTVTLKFNETVQVNIENEHKKRQFKNI